MSELAAQVQNYLEIYDPLGMAELAPVSALYMPVVPEVIQKLSAVQTPEAAAEAVHRVLFLTYGSQAGHPRNYGDLGRDLLKLVHKEMGTG